VAAGKQPIDLQHDLRLLTERPRSTAAEKGRLWRRFPPPANWARSTGCGQESRSSWAFQGHSSGREQVCSRRIGGGKHTRRKHSFRWVPLNWPNGRGCAQRPACRGEVVPSTARWCEPTRSRRVTLKSCRQPHPRNHQAEARALFAGSIVQRELRTSRRAHPTPRSRRHVALSRKLP
jgi:hypothetical protein